MPNSNVHPPSVPPYSFPYLQQTPYINPNELKEDEEIIFDYDKNGNLKSVRKVRRPNGCGPSVIVILVTVGILWGVIKILA
jgi:hypothetical protein